MRPVTVLFISMGFFIVGFELIRKKTRKIDIITIFNFWFLASYIIVPIITFNNPFYLNDFFVRFLPHEDTELFYSIIYIMLFYFAVIFSFRHRSKKIPSYIIRHKKEIKWKNLAFALLVISGVGLMLYIFGYGGLNNVMSNINRIRSGKIERNTVAAIARMFTNYSVIALLISFVKLKISSSSIEKLYSGLFFISAVLLTAFSSILSGGRGRLLAPVVLILLISIYIDKKWKVSKLIFIAPLFIIVVIYGKEILESISGNPYHIIGVIQADMERMSLMLKGIIIEFTHPYYSLLVSMDVTRYGENLLFFRNPIYTILFFGSLFGFPYHGTISHYNTQHIFGVFDSNIPPGIIALGYYDFYIIGIIIVGLIYGYFLGYIQSFFEMIIANNSNNEVNIPIYFIVGNNAAQFIFNGDIRVFLMSNFTTIIILIYVYILKAKIYRIRKIKN